MFADFDESHLRHGIPEGTILIIFGASGDLTRRKLMPALYHLSMENLIPQKYRIVGLGRRIKTGEEFKLHMKHRVMQYCSHKMENRYWKPLEDKMKSIRANYNDNFTYELLQDEISQTSEEWKFYPNILIYLATNPSHFKKIIEKLSSIGIHGESKAWLRIIVEKPFGLNKKTALELNQSLLKYLREDQIYRIDHFLGKEAIQNILLFRLYNVVFQPLWNKEYIDHIQITCFETIGVEGRVEFFEQTGVIRDMIQSHLLQILALLTLELPESLDQERIRDKKVEVLKYIRKWASERDIDKNTIRSQFERGVVNSELVNGYIEEEGTPENSRVETYAALRLFIDNNRWEGVPIYLRCGKRMHTRKTEIYIQFKNNQEIEKRFGKSITSNSLKLRIQPNAGLELNIGWKPPGILSEIQPTQLGITGEASLKEPKAYERLLVDAMRGDSTLFIRFDEILAMWEIVDPIVDYWKNTSKDINFPNYYAGTAGPKIADSFIKNDGRAWV